MKKNKIISLCLLGISSLVYSQTGKVGIQTENPMGTLHIDGLGDNIGNNLSEDQVKNDVIIKQDGKVGIGVIEPTTKLDIKANNPYEGFKLVDGSHGVAKVLTSDADGRARWEKPTAGTMYKTNWKNNVGEYNYRYTEQDHADSRFMKYTGASVILPPGKSLLHLSIFVKAKSAPDIGGERLIRFSLYTRDTPYQIGDREAQSWRASNQPTYISYAMHPSMKEGVAIGTLGVNNTSSSPRRYYLFVDTGASRMFKYTYTANGSNVNISEQDIQQLPSIAFGNNGMYGVDLIFNFDETFAYYQQVDDDNAQTQP